MAPGVAGDLKAGRDAAARYAWRETFDLLSAADAGSLPPEDLESLAEAAWWTGRLEDCIAARERAFAAYSERGDRPSAARVAMALAKDYYGKLSAAVGTAWVRRAERLLAGEEDCSESGYLERLHGVIAFEGAGDFDRAREHADRALEIGTRLGDPNLQAVALHDRGRALVATGQVEEGWALMDEATVAAVSGELDPMTTGIIYCNTITACEEIADVRRAGEWTDAAKRWCERQAISGFPGLCRVHRASVMRIRGAWPEAEQEARRACDELMGFNLGYAGHGFYELGEIRLRLGDLAAAEEAFRQAHELGRDPQPGLALLRLAQGNVEGARSCIEQSLLDERRDLHRVRLLPARAEASLAAGDVANARAAAEELERIAAAYGSEALQAGALATSAKVLLAEGDAPEAVRRAREALRRWQAVDAPYEAAEARALLAAAYAAGGDVESALLELRAAASTFERLGALPALQRVRDEARALGGEARLPGGDGQAARTFMFTDIVRSTSLVEAIGDEAWGDLVAWHDDTLRSLFAAHGGEEVDHAGDGFFVAFREPGAAVECATTIQRRLAAHRREHGFAPQVRIGLHSAAATRRGGGYKGRAVNAAARIGAAAEGGEILASRPTLEGLAQVRTGETRSVAFKGLSDPVEVCAVEWR